MFLGLRIETWLLLVVTLANVTKWLDDFVHRDEDSERKRMTAEIQKLHEKASDYGSMLQEHVGDTSIRLTKLEERQGEIFRIIDARTGNGRQQYIPPDENRRRPR